MNIAVQQLWCLMSDSLSGICIRVVFAFGAMATVCVWGGWEAGDKEMDQQLSQYGGVMFHCDFIGMKRRGSLVFLL